MKDYKVILRKAEESEIVNIKKDFENNKILLSRIDFIDSLIKETYDVYLEKSNTKYRDFMDITDDEIRQIVTDIFKPKKISCIKRSKKWEEITCKIYTEWEPDEGETKPDIICDELTIRDPWVNSSKSLEINFSVKAEDILLLKKFCFAKGICPYLKENQYIKEEETL